MKLIPDWLLSAISDGEGHVSSGRLIAVTIAFTCDALPGTVWAELSVVSGKMQEIPMSVVAFMGASGALATSLYAITKSKE